MLSLQTSYILAKNAPSLNNDQPDLLEQRIILMASDFRVGVATTLALCIVGTIYDVTIYKFMIEERKKDVWVKENGRENNTSAPKETLKISFAAKFIRCFSIDRNSRNIFSTSPGEPNAMIPLNGIRCITIMWVMMSHTNVYTIDVFFNRALFSFVSDDLLSQVLTNGSFNVDTFISMSGLLLGYYFLESEAKKEKAGIKESLGKKISLICLATLNRVIRLLPAYLFAIGFEYTTSALRHRQTIFWSEERNDITCLSNWWRNLLFINNFFPKAEMCMNWSWYLGSEMQNFLIGLVLLTLTTKYLKLAMFTFASVFVVAHAYTGYISYTAGYIPFLDSSWAEFDTIYSPTWTRVGPYFVGIAGGCFLQYFNRKLPFNKTGVALFWIAGVGLGTWIMFGFADKDMSLLSSALYMSLSRTAWALSTVMLLLVCLSGNGGFVNSFLSHSVWIPLGRASYCVYLINPIVIKVIVSYSDSAWEFGVPLMILHGLGFISMCFIIAFAFSILFEAPFLQLNNLLLGEKKQKAKRRKLSDNSLKSNVAEKKEL